MKNLSYVILDTEFAKNTQKFQSRSVSAQIEINLLLVNYKCSYKDARISNWKIINLAKTTSQLLIGKF